MTWTPLESVKRWYGSLAPGRRHLLLELLDPEIILEIQEGFPGTRSRYVGMKAYLEEFLYALYGTFELELVPEEYVESGIRVVTLGRQKARAIRTGIQVDAPFVHVWTVLEGRLVHARMFTDTALFRDAVEGAPSSAKPV